MRFLIVIWLTGLALLAGCGDDSNPPKPRSVFRADNQPTLLSDLDLSATMTIGNHSYLPISLADRPEQHVNRILRLLHKFEQVHPELIVTSWQIEDKQDGHMTSAYIYGLWVNHLPKTEVRQLFATTQPG